MSTRYMRFTADFLHDLIIILCVINNWLCPHEICYFLLWLLYKACIAIAVTMLISKNVQLFCFIDWCKICIASPCGKYIFEYNKLNLQLKSTSYDSFFILSSTTTNSPHSSATTTTRSCVTAPFSSFCWIRMNEVEDLYSAHVSIIDPHFST